MNLSLRQLNKNKQINKSVKKGKDNLGNGKEKEKRVRSIYTKLSVKQMNDC